MDSKQGNAAPKPQRQQKVSFSAICFFHPEGLGFRPGAGST